MTAVDAFLAEVLPQLEVEEAALHNGDPAPRMARWSHADPVTVFGAARTMRGWSDVAATFQWLGTRFSDCTHFDYEVVAAGVSGDLAYIAGVEHSVAAIGGEHADYRLRVTTVFRREAGAWRVVHRHADAYDEASARQVARLQSS